MQSIVYSQIFILLNSKPFILGENEVDSYAGKDMKWSPTEQQKNEARSALAAINKLLNVTKK